MTDRVVSLRVAIAPGVRFGPGKADLLDGIAATGSLAAAAERMGLSYRRAWALVGECNRAFAAPLVVLARGGEGGGGARLTEEGARVLAAYRALESRIAAAPEVAVVRSGGAAAND